MRPHLARLLALLVVTIATITTTMAFAFVLRAPTTRASMAVPGRRRAPALAPHARRFLSPPLLASPSSDNDDTGGRRSSPLTRNSGSSSHRRLALARWVGGMGLLGLALANLKTTLGANAAAVSDVQQQQQQGDKAAMVESGMGLDLSPMPLSEAMQAAEKEGVSKFGKRVLFDAATELPGSGVTSNGFKYSTKEDGVWVSAVSGVPLFDASAKYSSGTGWPSFFQPIDPAHVIERLDPKDQGKPQFLWRVEVLDRKSGTHLGHVFNDGPQPTGKRYCMNANSMKFIPRAQFAKHLASLPKVATTPTKGMGTEL